MNDPLFKTKADMQLLATLIDGYLNGKDSRKVGFALVTFNLGAPSIANHVSNVNRKDMIVSFREIAARLEGQPMQGGSA